ncbi:hypothetical protein CR492_12040 [Methylocella silvestris]|uniref:Uncharacterized protein n=1 Tax=Methylocella silvestris TaxID=199596 RepID=A0A2J7TFW4_METSI|nr:hypothetical protein CR492_12040 [Methylocella silvestris]
MILHDDKLALQLPPFAGRVFNGLRLGADARTYSEFGHRSSMPLLNWPARRGGKIEAAQRVKLQFITTI